MAPRGPGSSKLNPNEPCPTCGAIKHIYRSGRYLRKVDLAKENRKAFTVLSRDLSHLMKVSADRPLAEEESTAIRGYLKLIRDLIDKQDQTSSSISPEHISAIASYDPNQK